MSLRGSFLIAHPGLLDPNFRRSVIFISSHTPEEGAFGLVLTRPARQTVADLLPERDDLHEVGNLPVLHGGPVSQNQLIFAAFAWHSQTQLLECRHHLSLEEAVEVVRQRQMVVRAFVGYSGWGRGQLERELSQSGWLLKQPEAEPFESDSPAHLWRTLVSSFGATFQLTAEAPENPSLN